MPETTWSDGDSATAALLNQIEDQLVITTTSGSKPTGAEGRVIALTDSNVLQVYDGATWNTFAGMDWVTFTPSWTNLTSTSPTQEAAYRYYDGCMHIVGYYTLGTSPTVGDVRMTLPNSGTYHAAVGAYNPVGQVIFFDTTANTIHAGIAVGVSTDTVQLRYTTTSLTHLATSSTVPFTWAVGDGLFFNLQIPLA